MSLAEALAAEACDDLFRAADLYEQEIQSGNTALDVLLNLAVLYWEASDPGESRVAERRDFFLLAGRRYDDLLEQAVATYPESVEARFWRAFIRGISLGEPFDLDDARKLLAREPTCLVPAFFVFGQSKGDEAPRAAAELLIQVRDGATYRDRYVRRYLLSALSCLEEAGLEQARESGMAHLSKEEGRVLYRVVVSPEHAPIRNGYRRAATRPLPLVASALEIVAFNSVPGVHLLGLEPTGGSRKPSSFPTCDAAMAVALWRYGVPPKAWETGRP